MADACTVTRTDLAATVGLALTGPLDAHSAPGCQRAIVAELATVPAGRMLVVDLRGLEFIAVAGVRVLFRVATAARAARLQLRIVVEHGHHLRTIIERVDLDGRLPLIDQLDLPALVGDQWL